MGGDNALVVPVGSVGFPVHQICDHRRDGFAVSAADAVALDSAGGPGRAFFGERTPTAKERQGEQRRQDAGSADAKAGDFGCSHKGIPPVK